MKVSLIAIAVSCVLSGAAFGSQDGMGSHPPQFVAQDGMGSHPPQFVAQDGMGSHPPQ